MKVRVFCVDGKHRYWGLRFVPNLGKKTHGRCDPFDKPNKEILIKSGLSRRDTIDAVVHEVIHASNWWMDEEWVIELGHDIAHTLEQLFRAGKIPDAPEA